MAITIAQCLDAVADAFVGLAVGALTLQVQHYDELTEGMQDMPTMQVYPESLAVDSRNETDAQVLNKSIRNHALVVHLDCYAERRNHVDENMAAVVALWDATEDQLEDTAAGSGCPNFGQALIRNVSWTSDRAVFVYAGVEYSGIRYVLTLEIF
jgi:hypothetical protein